MTSPKLYNATRMLDIGELERRNNSYSFKNYVDKIRPSFENQFSKDFMFIHPNGRPFENPEQLRMFINRRVNRIIKTVFPKYYNYTCRHWCAVARLIRTKLEIKSFDVYEVKEWMGHTKIQTTMDYVQNAKFYFNKTGFDWIKRVLKNHHKTMVEDNSLKIEKPCFSSVQPQNNRSGGPRRLPDSNRRPLG